MAESLGSILVTVRVSPNSEDSLHLVGKTFWKTQILARGRRGKTTGRLGGVPGGSGLTRAQMLNGK
jgi:hypothetical protein